MLIFTSWNDQRVCFSFALPSQQNVRCLSSGLNLLEDWSGQTWLWWLGVLRCDMTGCLHSLCEGPAIRKPCGVSNIAYSRSNPSENRAGRMTWHRHNNTMCCSEKSVWIIVHEVVLYWIVLYKLHACFHICQMVNDLNYYHFKLNIMCNILCILMFCNCSAIDMF